MFRDLLPELAEQYEELIRNYRTVYPRGGTSDAGLPGGGGSLGLCVPQIHRDHKASTTAQAILEQFGLLRTSSMAGTDGFPYSPPRRIHAAGGAGCAPEDCLSWETLRRYGGRPRAGVRICAVRYGYGDPAALARWQPDYWSAT